MSSVKFSFQIRISDDLMTLAARYPKYAQAVLNRTATEAKTKAVRQIALTHNVQTSFIKNRISVIRSTGQRLVAIVRFSQKRFNPVWFLKRKEPTTRREVVELQVKRGESRLITGGYFVNIGRNSQRLFIKKQTTPGNDDGARTKLATLPFLKAEEIFDMPTLNALMERFANERIAAELPRTIKALYKAGK